MRTPDAEELLEAINGWVAIESKTDEPQSVARMIAQAEEDFRAAGLEVESIPARAPWGPHFHARAPWGGDGEGVLVVCHLDTVHPTGAIEKNPIRSEDDKAFGPGIYDMKAGVYLALAAARSLIEAEETTPLPLRFLVVSDEEMGSQSSEPHIKAAAAKASYVLVVEPARDGGKIVTGRKGVARMAIRARGKPAHSGIRHQDGESAILEIARQVVTLEGMTDYERGLTVNVGLIDGGTGSNVVPEHCSAEIDIRMVRLEDGLETIERIKALTPHNPAVALSITGGMNRPPYKKSNSVSALYEHARAIAAEIGFELEDTFTGGGSDGNFTAQIAPTLDGLGADGFGAHTLDEYIYISSLVPRMLLLRRLFQTLR